MYYLYCISYRITDEIKARKEAEKPFWWEHLHPEVKDLPIDEIEKTLIAGGISPEKIKEMTRHEKYMAVSEGHHFLEISELQKKIAEIPVVVPSIQPVGPVVVSNLDFLNGNIAGSGSGQLPSPNQPIVNQNMAGMPAGDDFEPISLSAKVQPNMGPALPDDYMRNPANQIKEEELLENKQPFNQPVQNVGPMPGRGTGNELRKYAQSIVRQTVNQVNQDADKIPDSISHLKEQDLLNAVINELQNIK